MIIVWTGATSRLSVEAVELMLIPKTGTKIPINDTIVIAIPDTNSIPVLKVVAKLKQQAKENTGYHIESIVVNFANIDNAKRFAQTIISRFGKVDKLILGVSIACWGPPSYTVGGTELGITINHLSQFAIIYHLRNHIIDRIIMVASKHYNTAFRFEDFDSSVAKLAIRPTGHLNLVQYMKYCDGGIGLGTISALSVMCLNKWAKFFSHYNVSIILYTPNELNIQAHSTDYIRDDSIKLLHKKNRFNLLPRHTNNVILKALFQNGFKVDGEIAAQLCSSGCRIPIYKFPHELQQQVWNWTCKLINEQVDIF